MTATTRPPARTDTRRPKRPQQLVNADRAAIHLLYLTQHGDSLTTIAEAVHTHERHLADILDSTNPCRAIRASLADAILAREGADTANPAGTQRRRQALVAHGIPDTYLAARLGMTETDYHALLRRPRIHLDDAQAFRNLYRELSMVQRPENLGIPAADVTEARRLGATHRWPRPLEWDDDDIDDPTAPEALRVERTPTPVHERKHELLEDALWIIRMSQNLDIADLVQRENVAKRLGIGIDYLDRLLKAHASGKLTLHRDEMAVAA